MVSSTKNLLVVEDNLINQKVMLGMLRTIGFKNIGLASNGMEAVRMVRGKPAAYDIVLMDVNMPIMDGHQATKEIRASGILVPIVAMTAYALKGDRELCIEHGMNDYIAKPVNKKRLIMVLAKWLLRMTDYRKNFDLRLAELQRHEEASRERPEGKLEQGPATGSSDAPVPAAVDLAKPSPSQPVTQESTRAAEAASSASQATSGLGHEAQQHVPAVAAKSAEPAAEAPAAAPPVATISHPQFERPVTAANIASLTAQTEAEKPPEVASSASLPHRAAAAASQESAFASAQAPTPAGGEGSDVPLAPSSSEGSDDASRGPTHAAEPGQVREVSEVPPQSEEPSSCRVPSDRKHDSTEEVNEVSHDITPAEADPSSETSGGGAGGAPIGVAGPETAVGGCR
jgi:osomolarity two-component system sensor histidine kinase TcsA